MKRQQTVKVQKIIQSQVWGQIEIDGHVCINMFNRAGHSLCIMTFDIL